MDVSLVWSVIWYAILGVSVFAYSLGDGFDLGLSSIYYIAKSDKDRRLFLNSIGPIWDGNEVWLIIIFGGLFAGFPSAYGALLSIFYMPIWCLVFLYICRGCALEFRSKVESKKWRNFWDAAFAISGMAIGFFLGSLVGNMILGLPLSPETPYASLSWELFSRPYAALCGALVISAFSLHGSTFMMLKISGDLHARLAKCFSKVLAAFCIIYLSLVVATVTMIPQVYGSCFALGNFSGLPAYPVLFALMILTLGDCLLIKLAVKKQRFLLAFLCSSCSLLLLIVSSIVLVFPNILLSTIDQQYSYTLTNAAASNKTLQTLFVIVILGLPLIIGYSIYVYRVFRGKTDFPSIY
ncbi:cytochrome d ubiquinol oxidase, subunit II [Chlamydia ibidis]|uniref:Cytochrome d ubiquinol oxidase, subunit II n=2 Tax=Chlamydia ibidis TaxID=1405396 RepID=S7KFW0_9CHLA|nr:cytochrome d ubiquinol oxidase subunit II [Chlamydia ibidis]EPP35076.1 cytochrome d ubiquinol oxidase, subunit II [Chlamydia ibidis]EQM62766.1 cytochrome d ubiquinol oxidase, subunit II [Chlamydia ibidis 10-1398/6]